MSCGRNVSCRRATSRQRTRSGLVTPGGQIMKLKAPAPSLLVSVIWIALFAAPAMAQTETKPPAAYSALPSEIPAKFAPKNDSFDHTRREVMIPMRDGVKLRTVILIPKGAKGAPMLM